MPQNRLAHRPRRTGRPRSPAEHPSTLLRGAKVGQIPPNPSICGGFVRESPPPLSDTHPAHPPESRGVSVLLFAAAPHEHHSVRPSLARSRALPAPDPLAIQRGGRRLSSSTHHSPQHRSTLRTTSAAQRYLTDDDRPRYPRVEPFQPPNAT